MNDRIISVSGILFPILLVLGFPMTADGIPGGRETTLSEAAAWLEDSGNRTQTIVGMYLMLAGGLAFLVFASALVSRLSVMSVNRTVIEVTRFAGLATAILIMASAALIASPAIQVWAEGEPRPVTGDTVRLASLGQNLLLTAGWTAGAAFVAAVSFAAIRSQALPRWLGLVGCLVAILLLFGLAFIPVVGLLAWTVCVAAVVFVRPASRMSAAGQAAAPA